MSNPLAVYLRDHEAAAGGGVSLFRRISRSQRRRPWGDDLAELALQVRADHRSLQRLMDEWGVRPSAVMGQAFRLAERAARWKPNGQLLIRSPLTDLIEIEAAQDAVHAKATGWRALLAAELDCRTVDLATLLARAEEQQDRLLDIHSRAARSSLAAHRSA